MSTAKVRRPAAVKIRLRRSPAAMAQLKGQMLERARSLCREEGLDALTMRRMADEFALSPMTLYSYFPSKQALLSELWVEVFEALVAALLRAAEGRRSPVKVLEAHLRAMIEFWEQRPDQYRMIYMSAPPALSGDTVDMRQQPVYAQLLLLTQERVSACCVRGAGEPSEAELRLSTDLLVAKLLGYLQLSLGLARYPLLDRAGLRERVLRDMLRAVAADPLA